MSKPTMKELAAVENERMLLQLQPNQAVQGRGYNSKVDLRAMAFDILKTREAWTVGDLSKRMRLKQGAAYQLLTELKRDGYLTCRQIHEELVFEHRSL